MGRKQYTVTLDDDAMISRIIERITGMPSLPFLRGETLMRQARRLSPVAAFVDINLSPEESGLDSIRALRQCWPHAAIIVVTSSTDSSLIGFALAAGANDFIRKPLDPDEVRARFVARCAEIQALDSSQSVAFGDIRANRQTRMLEGPSGAVGIPSGCMALLMSLADAKGIMVPRPDLFAAIWGSIRVGDNALDRKISDLRRLLRDVGSTLRIESTYGEGVALLPGGLPETHKKGA